MEWTIRAGAPDDIDRLRGIEIEAGARFRAVGIAGIAEDDPPSTRTLLAHVDDATIWVAVDGAGNPIGYAAASIVDGEGHLDQVSVVPEAAGRGIGRALIDRVHAWARAGGLETVTLTTFSEVAWNGPYYQGLGYRALAPVELGPELTAIRAAETAAGLDVSPRQAMRMQL